MALHERLWALPETRTARSWRGHVAACAVVTLLACMYLASVAWKGWIPFDDGMLAQTAQRVLEGQLPHRDFVDVYTGGLSFFHAAAFRLGGSSLGTLRATLLAVTTTSIPLWYYLAARFTPPVTAATITLAAVAWSVPNYPAAMPSWYNLILAIAALAAMLRYIDTQRRRWIFTAGFFAGLSILIKIIGVYLVAALALFLVHATTTGRLGENVGRKGRPVGTIALAVVAAALTVAPFLLVRSVPDVRSIIELALPPAAIAVSLVSRMTSSARQGLHAPLRSLANSTWPLALGVAIPVAIFTCVYWRFGAVHELVRGVFVLPRLRFTDPTMHTPGGPPLAAYAFTLPIVFALIVSPRRSNVGTSLLALTIGAAVVLLSLRDHRMMVSAWLSVRMLVLPLSIIVAARIAKDTSNPELEHRRDAMVLVTCVAAWCSLTQFPFGAPIYFSYVAPLVILAAVAVARVLDRPAPALGLPVIMSYAAFALAVRPQLYPRKPELSPDAERIDLPRGGIYVWPDEKTRYTTVVNLLHQHAGSPWILALPDVPEVYFLSGYKNPTHAIYDVFEDTTNRTMRVLTLAERHDVHTVVINRDPQVSLPIDGALNDSLARRFPESQTVGAFEVRWR